VGGQCPAGSDNSGEENVPPILVKFKCP
jgi:hypothetical protein